MVNKIKYDMEYSCQWLKEYDFLCANGIYPTFNKMVNGVKTYKYTKNRKLFEALAKFHN